MSTKAKVGVIGAGAWGTALAILANRAGSEVTLWTRNGTVIQTITSKRVNEAYLPDMFIDPAIRVTSNLDAICQCRMVIASVPSQSLRTLCITLSDLISQEVPIILACKGIERGSLALMSEVVKITLPANPIAVLSGPNFASEAAKGLPAATTLAVQDTVLGEQISYAIGSRMFRLYLTDDLIGVQIGGAVKNVIAIACGIAVGRKFGDNARAALIARGMTEIGRLAQIRGGRPETLMGLSGLGDLLLTCTSTQSRNLRLGMSIGEGRPIKEVLPARVHGLTEGVATADTIYEMAMKLGIDMPICVAVYHILKGHVSVEEGISDLLDRPLGHERR